MNKPRKRRPLAERYGKLTVTGEETLKGRRYGLVRCECGTSKRVLATSLWGGRTRSCGAPACRDTVLEVEAGFVPRGSRIVPPDTLKKIWAMTNRRHNPVTVADAARIYRIGSHQTLYSALRSVRKAGGWAAYARRLK